MKIDIYKPGSLDQSRGAFICIYGKSGVGKTATSLKSSPDPILYLCAERGNIENTIKAIHRPDIKLAVGYYEGWDDLLDTVYGIPTNPKFKSVKTVIFDSLTHVMNIHLADEIVSENYEAMDKNKVTKDLTMRVKMSEEGYGTLSKQMSRLMKGFEGCTVAGINVICTARETDSPKWNRSLAAAPALAGKEFPRDMKGFFDFIGLIESRFDDDGNIVYPPLISCDDDGSFLSKWTGVKPDGGVIRKWFDVGRMLKIARGE
jgi:hypothetical protein